jgi:ribokinase
VTDVVVAGGVFREVFIEQGQSSTRLGGSGLTAAIAASRLGAQTALVATVGADDADEAVAVLREAGVNTSWISVEPGASGIFVFEDVADTSAPRPLFRPAESAPVKPQGVPEAKVNLAFGMPQADPLSWLSEGDRPVLIWDRQGWLSRSRSSEDARHRPEHRRVFVANWGEFVDEFGPELAAEMLAGSGVPGFATTIIKAGPWGVTVVDSGARHGVPAFYVEPNNVIGSGDTFAGALAAGLAAGHAPDEAALEGGVAAAVALQSGTGPLAADSPQAIAGLLANARRSYVDPTTLGGIKVGLEPVRGPGSGLLGRVARQVVEHLGLTVVDPHDAEIKLSFDDSIVSMRNELIDEVRQKVGVEEPS